MPLKLAITGSHGLIGSALTEWFTQKGWVVTPIVRSASSNSQQIIWDIDKRELNAAQLEGYDVVIHLAGASIADKRWTPSYKKLILESRIASTALLSESLAKLKQPPKVF